MLPHEKFGFRSKIQMYRVKRDAKAGIGQALSQDSAEFGKGGGTQYFISNYRTVLEPIGLPFDIGV